MKTKGHYGKPKTEAGMSMKRRHLAAHAGNVIENKGC
jgi:hypothetical protein